MLRGSRHEQDWTDEELESLVNETSGYELEDDFDEFTKSLSARRRIEELRELRRLRANLDDFEGEIEEDFDDFDDGYDEEEYSDEWH